MLQVYEVDSKYIDYLSPSIPHLFHNAQAEQRNTRKYIGIVLTVNNMNYFVPLSSLKQKHKKMSGAIDLIQIGNYAVLNINNMFPVPDGYYTRVDFSSIQDEKYAGLLRSEYRIIKKIERKIIRIAKTVYSHKMKNESGDPLSNRTNNFKLLERLCKEYIKQQK